ncbi:MAG: MgtC/SapB family protein [Firmicutes bacterium]|nr:MgtC/SapB family protein [Bacillota bacterium]
MPSNWLVIARLVVATLLGGIIGLQRESVNRPAGFRTHVLVSVGSALVMLVSIYGFNAETMGGRFSDPARLAAQVVSGIGFLGAGTILKEGSSVRGLTTAASLWVVAGVGLAVGSGFYLGAVVTTVIVFLALSAFANLDDRLLHRAKYQTVIVDVVNRPGQLGAIGEFLGAHNISIRSVYVHNQDENESVRLKMFLQLPIDCQLEEIMAGLASVDGVLAVTPRR